MPDASSPRAFIFWRSEKTRIRLRGVRAQELAEGGALVLPHLLGVLALVLPQVDQGIGGRVVLRRGLRPGHRAHPAGGEAAHRIETEGPPLPRVSLGAQLPADGRSDRGVHVTRLDQVGDQPDGAVLLPIDGLAGQHGCHRRDRIECPRRAKGAAEPRVQADLDLREARLQAGEADALVAGQRELEAAAEAMAVDHGDGREREPLEPIEDRMAAL
jgi:hypothetical protein